VLFVYDTGTFVYGVVPFWLRLPALYCLFVRWYYHVVVIGGTIVVVRYRCTIDSVLLTVLMHCSLVNIVDYRWLVNICYGDFVRCLLLIVIEFVDFTALMEHCLGR